MPLSEHMTPLEFGPAETVAAALLIEVALNEDLGDKTDITSTTLIPADLNGSVQIVSRQPGRLSGVPIGQHILEQVDPNATWTTHVDDGQTLESGTVIATLTGSVRSLLTAERTILNFMTHLSGVASLTQQFVEKVAGTTARILDTRKTLPGWRLLQKYAVRCGGGTNHRMGLWDAVLIKDNHIAALADDERSCLADVVTLARQQVPEGTEIVIEVDTLDQLTDALAGLPNVVLLDNMDFAALREAVKLRDDAAPAGESGVLLEASGGVNLDTVARIAQTGVDRISIGALTHSAPSLDLGFDWR